MKSARNNPAKYGGWLWIHCSSKKFQRRAGKGMHERLRVLTESVKVGSTATVSGTVYWSYPILPFEIVTCTFFFRQPFSKRLYSLCPLLEAWKIKGVGIFKGTNCSYLLSKKLRCQVICNLFWWVVCSKHAVSIEIILLYNGVSMETRLF